MLADRPAPPIKGKARRIKITLDEHLIAAIDRTAAEAGLSRSGFKSECPFSLMRTEKLAYDTCYRVGMG